MRISLAETEPGEAEFFLKQLRTHQLEFCAGVEESSADTEALSVFVNSRITDHILHAHPALRLIATRSTTLDHIDLEACAQRGVTVCNVGGSYGDHTVPEHIFALMLALCRKLRPAMDVMAGRKFSYEALRGIELNGRTMGVVGTGRIGRQVLRLARAFGMKTLGYDSQPEPAAARELGFRYVKFDRMLRLADYISINVPLTPATYHLFNKEAFALCRRGMILINTARGAIIDTEALIEALNAGIVAGAGLDVLEDERVMRKGVAHILTDQIITHLRGALDHLEPLGDNSGRISELRNIMRSHTLLDRPNVIVTPHIAFNSHEAIARINRVTVENIRAFARGRPRNVVTPPAA